MLFNSVQYGVDPLGDSLGVLMDMTDDNFKVENLFESDRYKEFVTTMHDWYEKDIFRVMHLLLRKLELP